MNDKVYADVYFPALNATYYFLLPLKMKVRAAVGLMAGAIIEKEQIRLEPESLILFNKDGKVLLDANLSIAAAGITDGMSLLLV